MRVAVIQLLDSPCVRTRKVINGFLKKGMEVTYIGVPRGKVKSCDSKYKTILLGKEIPRGSFKKIYLQVIFFYLAKRFLNHSDFDIVYAVDFDGVIPVYFSKYKGRYIYDVLDTYADRYNLPYILKKLIRQAESCMAFNAKLLIHVDESRVVTLKKKKETLILQNVPEARTLPVLSLSDHVEKKERYFLISGGVFKHRGLCEILQAHSYFCTKYFNIKLVVIGRVPSEVENMLSGQSYVDVIGEVSSEVAQQYAFKAYGIFALYEPSSEINLNACPNKIYDCLFNATPVIINSELYIADKYKENQLVFTAEYSNIPQIADAMMSCINARNKKKELIDIAQEYRASHSWERQFEKVLSYYETIN